MVERMSRDPEEADNNHEVESGAEEVEFHVETPESVMKEGMNQEYQYARLGLIIGALALVAGVVLVVFGYSGSVDVTFQSGSSKGHLVTGSLGVVIALIGLGIIFITLPKVRTTNQQDRSDSKKSKKGSA